MRFRLIVLESRRRNGANLARRRRLASFRGIATPVSSSRQSSAKNISARACSSESRRQRRGKLRPGPSRRSSATSAVVSDRLAFLRPLRRKPGSVVDRAGRARRPEAFASTAFTFPFARKHDRARIRVPDGFDPEHVRRSCIKRRLEIARPRRRPFGRRRYPHALRNARM